MRIYTSIQELVGKTPIVELKKIEDKLQLKGRIYAKLESFNPAGSVKDRIAKAMIEDAKRRGVIQEGSVLVDGEVDYFVAGVGTGGTITGTGEFLKSKNRDIKVVAVEPEASPVLSRGEAGPHKIQGIGAGFVPEILDTNIYDEVISVEAEDAFETSRLLARTEGILAGISSGAALWASIRLARSEESRDKNVVVLLPDTGERYLSTELFS